MPKSIKFFKSHLQTILLTSHYFVFAK